MAKNIMADGLEFNKLRSSIASALAACKRKEKELSKAGCQSGNIHFKTGRPNTMYINEPTKNGKRKYIHVGVNAAKQKEARERVKRWAIRDSLRNHISKLENDLQHLDYRFVEVMDYATLLEDHSRSIVEEYI